MYYIIEKKINIKIYEKMGLANSCLSKWNANLGFISKLGQKQS